MSIIIVECVLHCSSRVEYCISNGCSINLDKQAAVQATDNSSYRCAYLPRSMTGQLTVMHQTLGAES